MYGHDITENERNKIITELESLCKEAEEKKMWLYNRYADIWVSPDELRQHNKKNEFVWGVVNWELRNPYERLNEYCTQISNIEKSKAAFSERIKASGL